MRNCDYTIKSSEACMNLLRISCDKRRWVIKYKKWINKVMTFYIFGTINMLIVILLHMWLLLTQL